MILYYSFFKSLALEKTRYRALGSMCINSYNCTLISNYFNKKINKEGGERGGEGRKKETKERKKKERERKKQQLVLLRNNNINLSSEQNNKPPQRLNIKTEVFPKAWSGRKNGSKGEELTY